MVGSRARAALVLVFLAPLCLQAAVPPAAALPEPSALPLSPTATYPLGIPDPFDYSDVVLIGNNNSQTSRNLTLHFQQVHSVPSNNVLFADMPVGESISEAQWDTFAAWFAAEMSNRSLGSDINYIVTFKGMPIRVYWTTPGGPTSFQDALMLLGGTYEGYIGNANLYPNPYFNRTARFSFAQFGIRLVTGIYAYNESTAMALMDRAANSLGSRGEFVLDADGSKGFAGGHGTYAYANAALVWANASLTADGWPTYLDTNNTYVTGRTGVMGYSSWGSNDCCWGSVTQVALPHNTWVNGSIGETFVSTGARTFTWPPSYGQSLIADWLDEGANGMKGYTDEPYINAIADGHILHGRYTHGYNMAESYWAASHFIGWRQIVVGDPKMAAYADIGDLAFNQSITSTPALVVQNSAVNITVGVDNTAPIAKTADLRISVGGFALENHTLALPARSSASFRIRVDFSGLPPSIWGQPTFDLALDPDGALTEWNESNNAVSPALALRRPPIAAASVVDPSVPTGDTVQLAMSTLRADRPIVWFVVTMDGDLFFNYIAAVGDAGTFNVSLPRSGSHFFTLFAVDVDNVSSLSVSPIAFAFTNRAPVGLAAANTTTPNSLNPVRFDASASGDPDGAIVDYEWAVSGLAAGSGVEFTWTFPAPGNFSVELVVTDDEGATASALVAVQVANRAPLARLSSNVSSAATLTPVRFSAEASSDPDGSVVHYRFDFDDGTRAEGTVPTADHAFLRPGTQGLWLTVSDDWGGTARARWTVEALNRAPTASWTSPVVSGAAQGVAVTFGAYAHDVDGLLTSFSLDFGDGRRTTREVTGTDLTVAEAHTYVAEGNFAVTLTVADDSGETTVLLLSVPVIHPAPTLSSAQARVVGENFTVDYAADSPYGNLELIVERNGSLWRQVGIDGSGTLSIPLGSLAPGSYGFEVYVSDGTARSQGVTGTFTINETSQLPPPPPRPPPPPPARMTIMSFALVGVAIAATAVVAVWALVLRKRK